jgi:two-component system response regulator AtoC/two-component system nitrogen regulation response regulator NtrX
VHPLAVVVAIVGDAPTPVPRTVFERLSRLRAKTGGEGELATILGLSSASEALRQRVQDLAASRAPVLFAGEVGTGRRHAARYLHAVSHQTGSFVVVPTGEAAAIDASLNAGSGTVFFPSIEDLSWSAQEALAAKFASASTRPRVTASIGVDPGRAADEGRLSPALAAAFRGTIVTVPPLRERRLDIAVLVRAFIEELRGLNPLPPIAVAPEAMSALERCAWPRNVAQLRSAVESAVILASEGTVRLRDLPEDVVAATGTADAGRSAQRRFREAKRLVVEAFERSYLEDLLKRHGGNVTGAAEQSGMLRSALQRLLRKHELHSADFRRREDQGERTAVSRGACQVDASERRLPASPQPMANDCRPLAR